MRKTEGPVLLELSTLWGKTQRHIRGSGGLFLPRPGQPLSCLAHTTPRAGTPPTLGPLSNSLLRCQLPVLSARTPLLCCSVWDCHPSPGSRKGQGLGLPSLPPSSQGLLTLGPQECLVENKLADGQTGRWTISRDRATQSEVKATSLESPGVWTDNALESAERTAQLPGHWRQNGFVAENTGRGPTLGGRQGDTCNSKRKHQPPREVRPPRGSSG